MTDPLRKEQYAYFLLCHNDEQKLCIYELGF